MRARHRPCHVLRLLLPLLTLGFAMSARAVTVEQIPSPRPTGWAVDMTGTLPPERLAELNSLGDEVKAKTGAEMAVVVVSSTDGVASQEFATRLFNAWRIGQRGRNNGLLVFAALADRRAEIVLGRGLDGERNRGESAVVMRDDILPRFRAGDPAGAVVQGALGCARRIFDVSPLNPEAAGTETAAAVSQPEQAFGLVSDTTPPQANVPPIPPAAEYAVDTTPQGGGGAIFIWLGGGLGFLLLAYWFFALRAPHCPRCKEKMRQLDETEEKAFLAPSEQVEESIGSINYQVWECPGCGEHKKKRGSAFFSRYKTCPDCGAKTLSSTSTTLATATNYSCGSVEVRQACANCPYTNTYTESTPMLEDTSTSTSSATAASSALFSSTSSLSSSSSVDSSSSGFSGGDSSGGGASGSW
jgi:uncharacterized protein